MVYNDEEKTISWLLGYKDHGDKRHRSSVKLQGINYRDGEKITGPTREIEVGRRVVWSRKHDNRLAQNDETVAHKIMSFEETFNKLRTFSSLDMMQGMSATVSGTVMGIGGNVTTNVEARQHTELETEKFNTKRKEIVIEDSAHLHYPGPLYKEDDTGRTLIEEGPIWLIERPVATIHTVTPITPMGYLGCSDNY